ncbi:MAG: chemotaxis protein CheC [Lachnospirales bacterium]
MEINSTHKMKLDYLKELSNIGAGNALMALSEYTKAQFLMDVPKISFLDIKDIPNIFGDPEELIIGTLSFLENDIRGIILFVQNLGAAEGLYSMFGETLKIDVNNAVLEDEEREKLIRTGRIMFDSYFNALATMLNLNIGVSDPKISIDMAGAILSVPATEYGKYSDTVLIIDSVFKTKDQEFNGFILMIPDSVSFDKLFKIFM